MSNSIAISRVLVAAGLEQKAADAIAEQMVTHADQHVASADIVAVRADIARIEERIVALEHRITVVEQQIKMQTYLSGGIFVGVILLLLQQLG